MFLKVNKQSEVNLLLGQLKHFLKDYEIEKTKRIEIKTIISELIYNIQKYTPNGSIVIEVINNDTITICAKDQGGGIDNVNLALQDGYSTSGTLGLGFASIFRLSDEIDVNTSEEGTEINIKKSLR